ncbi:acyltransferase family protein, partial [Plectonema radiosum NIES-515]
VCTFTYEHSLQTQAGLNFNGVFWSLSTEVQFYLVVPFIYNFLKYRLVKPNQAFLSGILILIITFIIRLIFWILFRNEISEKITYFIKYSYTPLITNLDYFLCGFFVNIWLKYKPLEQSKFTHKFIIKNLHKKYIAVILLILLYLFTARHSYHQELWNLPERNGKGVRTATSFFILQPITALITAFFVLTFESDIYHVKNNEKLSFCSILKNPIRILEVFGNLSYGVYIWHFPLVEKITPIFTSSIPIEAFYKRVIATLILSTVLATVTYYLVELPFARQKTLPQLQK